MITSVFYQIWFLDATRVFPTSCFIFPSQLNSAQCVFDSHSVFIIILLHSNCSIAFSSWCLHIFMFFFAINKKQGNPLRTAHPAQLQPMHLSCSNLFDVQPRKTKFPVAKMYFIRRTRNKYCNDPVQMKYAFLVIVSSEKLVNTNIHVTHPS